jgi:AraC-like DNA-binding protein
MKRFTLYITLLVCSFFTNDIHAQNGHSDFYYKWVSKSTPELIERANTFLYKRNMIDSALVCYSVIANRYEENMPTDKKLIASVVNAKFNIGYLYCAYYYDFSKAYDYLQQSLSLSKQYNMKDYQPYIYLNMGYIMDLQNQFVSGNKLNMKFLKCIKKAFATSVEIKDLALAQILFTNLISTSIDFDRLNAVNSEIKRMESIHLSDSLKMKRYTMALCNGIEAYMKKDYGKALSTFQGMHKLINADTENNRERFSCITSNLIFQTYIKLHDYANAEKEMKYIENALNKTGLEDFRMDCLYKFYQFYKNTGNEQKAKDYELKYLRAKNEFFIKSNIITIGKTSFLNQLKSVNEQLKDTAEKRRNTQAILIIVSIFALLITISLILLIRAYRKQKVYTQSLYEKNMEMLKSEDKERHEVDKYQSSNLTEDSKELLLYRISKIMESKENICSADFSIQRLAELAGTNQHYISQVINEKYGKSFKTVLNEKRIKEACRLLNDIDNYGQFTIESIATEVGFNNRSHFAVVFKKVTGLSASEFQHIAKSKNSSSEK